MKTLAAALLTKGKIWYFSTLFIVLALTFGGCVIEEGGEQPPEGEECAMSDLFKGLPGGAFGNTFTSIPPAQTPGVAPFGWGEIKTLVKFPGHLRKGNMAHDGDPCVVTASVYAEPNPTAAFAGPLTGIALWGSGGGSIQTAEFDIPIVTSFDPDVALVDPSPFDTPKGGTMISVPCTSLEIRARNDAQLLPAGPNGDGSGQSPIGGAVGTFIGITSLVAPASATASLAKGIKNSAYSATKTVWAVNSIDNATGVLPAGSSIQIRIPPFAKAFRIARASGNAGLLVGGAIQFTVFGNANAGDGLYTVANGVIAPEVKISGGDNTVFIRNSEAAIPINRLYVIFFLDL